MEDVGMAELGDGLGLDAEPGEVVGPRLLASPDHLHRDHAVQPGLAGQVDHPHAPLAELLYEVVAGDPGSKGCAGRLVAVLGGTVVQSAPAYRTIGIRLHVIRGLMV